MRASAGLISLILIGTAIVAASVHFMVYLHYAVAAVRYPFELFDAEGIVWQQAMLIPGTRMYGDIDRFPFIVFHYPPLYHLLVRGLSAIGVYPLIAGRSISLIASIVTAALAASFAFSATSTAVGRCARLAGAATTGLIFFCFAPVVACSPLMRVDMLAIALSFLGVWFATLAGSRPRFLYVAITLFVLAAFTKQTSIAAPIATMAVMALVNLKLTLRALCFGLLLGSLALLILSQATDGGFLRHIIFYNINRFSVSAGIHYAFDSLSAQLGFVALAIVSVPISWKRLALERSWQNPSSIRHDLAFNSAVQLLAIMTLYLAITTCMLVMIGKSGAGLNYFVEWMAVLSVLIGVVVAGIVSVQLSQRKRDAGRPTIVLILALPLLLLMQVLRSPTSWDFNLASPIQSQQLEQLLDRIRHADRPVLSDDMVLLMKAGKEVPWEPAIFIELASTGRWDERRITDLIASHYFGFVISHGNDDHFGKSVGASIQNAYPLTKSFGDYLVHLPPE